MKCAKCRKWAPNTELGREMECRQCRQDEWHERERRHKAAKDAEMQEFVEKVLARGVQQAQLPKVAGYRRMRSPYVQGLRTAIEIILSRAEQGKVPMGWERGAFALADEIRKVEDQ